MTTVRHIPQTHLPYYSRKDCQHEVLIDPASMHRRKRRCRHKFVYEVNGKKLCALHAGQATLAAALGVKINDITT